MITRIITITIILSLLVLTSALNQMMNQASAVEDVGSHAHDIPKAEHPKCEPCFHPSIKKQLPGNILFII
jgi:hypothetical protein